MRALSLLSQDVVVLGKLLSYSGRRPPLVRMAVDLVLSTSQVHAALTRLAAARLVFNDARLALLDALRDGRARERNLAANEIAERVRHAHA